MIMARKKVGRPKKEAADKLVQVAFRIPEGEKSDLESVARSMGLDVSNFLRMALKVAMPSMRGMLPPQGDRPPS